MPSRVEILLINTFFEKIENMKFFHFVYLKIAETNTGKVFKVTEYFFLLALKKEKSQSENQIL